MRKEGRRVSQEIHRVYEPINLGHLRWLVKKCEGMPDTSQVKITQHKSYNPLDWDEGSIEVSGEVLE